MRSICLISVLLLLCSNGGAVKINHAVVSNGGISYVGSANPEIRWGSVLASGNITLNRFEPLNVSGKRLSADLHAQAAGIYRIDGRPEMEEWLRYVTSGSLMVRTSTLTELFPSSGINGVPVIDFFSQVMNGEFAGWNSSNVLLGGQYVPMTVPLGAGILYAQPIEGVYMTGTGALVQNWPAAGAEVQEIMSQFTYQTWKDAAIAEYGYLRPASGGIFRDIYDDILYVNADGQLTTRSLGNTVLRSLNQISMTRWLAQTDSSVNSYGLPDRILFIDTLQGTPNGTRATLTIDSSMNFFWKGIVYANCDLQVAGGNLPPVLVKNPHEFEADPWGGSTGYLRDRCMLDGVLFMNGTITLSGATPFIYGALVCPFSISSFTAPEVLYNSRLKKGVLPTLYSESYLTTYSGYLDHYAPRDLQGGEIRIPEGVTVTTRDYATQVRSLINSGTLNLQNDLYLRGGRLVNYGTLNLGAATLVFGEGGTLENHGTITQDPTGTVVFGVGTSDTMELFLPGCSAITGDVTLANVRVYDSQLQLSGANVRISGSLRLDGNARVEGSPVLLGNAQLIYSDLPAWNYIPGGEWRSSPEEVPDLNSVVPEVIVLDDSTLNLYAGTYAAGRLSMLDPAAILLAQGRLIINDQLENYGLIVQRATITPLCNPVVENYGLITCTYDGIVSGPLYYGFTGIHMDGTFGPDTASVMVDRYDFDHPFAAGGIQTGRYWSISTDSPAYNVSLTLPYDGTVTDPYVCRYTGSGNSWSHGRTSFGSGLVTLDGITELSEWAVGDAALGPVPVELSGFGME